MRRVGLEERELWSQAVHGVAPLRADAAPFLAAPQTAASPSATAPQQQPPHQEPPSPDGFFGIDRANAERLKRGRHKIEARLDLHGMTQTEAFEALATFVGESRRAGRRCVLVITGRGLATNEPGILRRAVPRWLREKALRPHILAIAAAQPRHGGAGALYVLLRRTR